MATFLILLAGVWALAYFCAPLVVWAGAVAAALILLQIVGVIGWSAILLWPLAIAFFTPFFISDLRNKLFTEKIFAIFRKVLPPMSETEREAIEAGNTWWEAKLFQGKPNWHDWLQIETPKLTSDEQNFLNNQVEHLCSLVDDWDVIQKSYDLSPEVWDYLKEQRFFGMIIPKKYGGLEFSALAHSTIITKISTASGSLAVTTMVPNSLGPAELLLKYGTEKQKDYYLPKLASGEEIPCFALTSPEAGSDAGAIQDTGVICKGSYAGKKVLGIRLNWDKRYITLAPVATVLGLAFKLYDPEHLLGERESLGITVCLIPTNTPGVEIGKRHFPLAMSFMNGPTRGKDVFIPIDWIIGGREMAGQGWRMLMECLAAGRAISLPALSTSTALITYRMTGAYAAIREQFRIPIGYFEGIQSSLARIGGFTYTIEAARQMTASALDIGERPGIVSAIAKYHMTEMARKAVTDGMDIHAGKTIMLGPNNYLAKYYQVQPISITVEGANILTRSLMIFGQGAIRCHPYVRDEIKAATLYEEDPIGAIKTFDDAIWSHIRYFFSNLAKGLFMGLTCAWLKTPPKRDKMYRYFQKLSWFSTALALTSDVAMMIMGGKLKKAEQLSARLGDVLSHLYLSSCILKYYYEHGGDKYHEAHAVWALDYSLHKSQIAFYEFFDNFPIRFVGIALRAILFPFGAHCSHPTDKQNKKVALQMMEDTEFRRKLTEFVFLPQTLEGPTVIEQAFEQLYQVKPFMDKLDQAIKEGEIDKSLSFNEKVEMAAKMKLLTPSDKKELLAFDQLRKQAIAVDEFSGNFFEESTSEWNKNTVALKSDRFSS